MKKLISKPREVRERSILSIKEAVHRLLQGHIKSPLHSGCIQSWELAATLPKASEKIN